MFEQVIKNLPQFLVQQSFQSKILPRPNNEEIGHSSSKSGSTGFKKPKQKPRNIGVQTDLNWSRRSDLNR